MGASSRSTTTTTRQPGERSPLILPGQVVRDLQKQAEDDRKLRQAVQRTCEEVAREMRQQKPKPKPSKKRRAWWVVVTAWRYVVALFIVLFRSQKA